MMYGTGKDQSVYGVRKLTGFFRRRWNFGRAISLATLVFYLCGCGLAVAIALIGPEEVYHPVWCRKERAFAKDCRVAWIAHPIPSFTSSSPRSLYRNVLGP